jgi:3-oxoacyl-[acyl-carrier-protein] synthase-1
MLEAIKHATERLASGQAEIWMVAGVDSYLDPDTLDWLDANRQLDRDGVRSGFTPGEAASALVIAGETARRYLPTPPLGQIRGVHTAIEPKVIGGDEEVLGEGLHRAVAGAIAGLQFPAEAMDVVYSDINGERYRTDEWGAAAIRLGPALRGPGYHVSTTSWGDVGAASAGLAFTLAIRAWARGYSKGPRALVWGSSPGGLRGAAVLQEPGQ